MYTYQIFTIATAALLPVYLVRLTIFSIPTNLLEILMVISAGLTVVSPVVWRDVAGLGANKKKFYRLISLTCLFIISAVISAFISPHLHTGLGILKSWIVLPVIFGLTVFFTARDDRVRRCLIQALILSGTVMALLGISQLGELDRVKGVYDVPNSLALYLAPLIPLALWSGGRLNKFLAAVMGIALLLTQSVGGILAVGTVLSASALYPAGYGANFLSPSGGGRWSPALTVCVLVLIVFSYLFSTGRLEYLASPFVNEGVANSLSVRQQLWSVSWELVKENPILGIGLGVFEPYYQNKVHERFYDYQVGKTGRKPLAEFVFRDPHNWILSFWLNTGLLGLLSFTGINIWVFWRAFNNGLKFTKEHIGVLSALAVVLIFGLADTIYWKNDLAVWWWILIGLTIYEINNE